MADELDFWVGEWNAVWDGGAATNTITKELDGAVVVERFESPELRGLSVSVPGDDGWRQTWVDSQGSYLSFKGGIVDGVMELRNETHRMRFLDVAPDSFTWVWERKEVAEWKLQWRIAYSRRG